MPRQHPLWLAALSLLYSLIEQWLPMRLHWLLISMLSSGSEFPKSLTETLTVLCNLSLVFHLSSGSLSPRETFAHSLSSDPLGFALFHLIFNEVFIKNGVRKLCKSNCTPCQAALRKEHLQNRVLKKSFLKQHDSEVFWFKISESSANNENLWSHKDKSDFDMRNPGKTEMNLN